MEDLIVVPIERKAREIGEIEDNALMTTGSAVITLTTYDSVSKQDLDAVSQDIRNRMEDVKTEASRGHGRSVREHELWGRGNIDNCGDRGGFLRCRHKVLVG